jgi:hypothetical protein
MKNLILLTFFSYLICSCNDPDPREAERSRQIDIFNKNRALITIKALDQFGRPVPNAKISFYDYADDLYYHRNQIARSELTDENGSVTIGWNNLGRNYILVESDCLNNYLSGTAVNVTDRSNNVFTSVLNETGTLTIQSTSSNPYRIYIDNVAKMDLPGKQSITLKYFEAKPTSVRVEQLEGYIFATVKSYDLDIKCGGSFNVTYP